MTAQAHSRKSLLRRGLLAAAAAVGVGAGAGAVTRSADAAETLRLEGRGWTATTPGRRFGERVQAGDATTVHGELHDAAGRVVGTFLGTRLAAPGRPAASTADVTLELHTFTLEDGTILGMGSARADGAAFAVVGGSGRYAGARGSYVADQRPYGLGGNGTATFDLTLTS